MGPIQYRRAVGSAMLAVPLLLGAAFPAEATAQIKASEKASTMQTIDGTTITVEYSRPSLRGRDARVDLFGDQITWGYVWTPGANQATTLEADKDIELNGVAVPAGRYSVWMVVDPEEWEFVLDPRDDLFHTQGPQPAEDQIRFPILPDSASYSVESLVWTFPAVRADGADLRMQWGDLAVDLEVAVEPTAKIMLTDEEAIAYVGVYQVEQLANARREAREFEFELRHEDGILLGDMQFSADFSMEVGFVVAADQVLKMGFIVEGEIAEVDPYTLFEFVLDEDGCSVSFEVRNQDDELRMRGTRLRP